MDSRRTRAISTFWKRVVHRNGDLALGEGYGEGQACWAAADNADLVRGLRHDESQRLF